jgi:hypothetical protein
LLIVFPTSVSLRLIRFGVAFGLAGGGSGSEGVGGGVFAFAGGVAVLALAGLPARGFFLRGTTAGPPRAFVRGAFVDVGAAGVDAPSSSG